MQKLLQVAEALEAINIPTVRSYTLQALPELHAPIAAVGVHRVTAREAVVAVTIYASPEAGGGLCETAAYSAFAALEQLGAVSSLGPCQYDKATGLLAMELLASWTEPEQEAPQEPQPEQTLYSVLVEEEVLPYVTALKAQKITSLCPIGEIGEGMRELRWEDTHWDITVEELLPPEAPIADTDFDMFTLKILRPSGTEEYPICRWVSVLRKETKQGIQQVRIARTWETRRDSHA